MSWIHLSWMVLYELSKCNAKNLLDVILSLLASKVHIKVKTFVRLTTKAAIKSIFIKWPSNAEDQNGLPTQYQLQNLRIGYFVWHTCRVRLLQMKDAHAFGSV